MEWILWLPVIVGGICCVFLVGKMLGLYLNKNRKEYRTSFSNFLYCFIACAVVATIFTVIALQSGEEAQEEGRPEPSVCEQSFRIGDIKVRMMRNGVLLTNAGPEQMGYTYYQFETREMTNGMYGDAKVWKHNTVFAGLKPGENFNYFQGARMAEDIGFVRIRPEGWSKWYEIDVLKCEMKIMDADPDKFPPW